MYTTHNLLRISYMILSKLCVAETTGWIHRMHCYETEHLTARSMCCLIQSAFVSCGLYYILQTLKHKPRVQTTVHNKLKIATPHRTCAKINCTVPLLCSKMLGILSAHVSADEVVSEITIHTCRLPTVGGGGRESTY